MKTAWLAVLTLVVGCSPSPSVDPPIPGFAVTAKTTHVVIGTVELDTVVDQYHRTQGSVGAYLESQATGGSLGSVNAEPVVSESYPGSISDHESLVRAYYRPLGLPEDQVDLVASGVSTGSTPSAPRQVHTSISRQVDGFLVADSLIAVACLDALRCVDEHVFWPPIPYDVVRAARAFDQGPAYRARLPVQVGGAVTIHHTGWKTAPVVFTVTFDVLVGTAVKSFDRDAREVVLPL